MKAWILRQNTTGKEQASSDFLVNTQEITFDAKPFVPTQKEIQAAEELGISPFLLHILHTRGLKEHQEIHDFLSPNLRLLAPLDAWPGLPQSAEILTSCIIANKKIAVWGDYDVDGITSTCLVLDVLAGHGIDALWHVPSRATEGYGLNNQGIDALIESGAEVLLTVDCGISDNEAIEYARQKGLTVIISDHHLPPEVLPKAHAICNPQLAPCPCPHLAGVGVAFFLMCAVNNKLEEHFKQKYDMRQVLDLVALGTLADVVSLQGQNRVLVKNGLLMVTKATRPGLAALKKVCKFTIAAKLGASQVVFTLAPRINAAGRMGHADKAVQLLRSKDLDTALPLAFELDSMNADRKKEEEQIHKEAREQAHAYKDAHGLVLYGAHWHSGIIGIVASRIMDEFNRPVLILCDSNGIVKGSGRSIKQFHIHEGISELATLLLGYGGHRLAAGLSLLPENIEKLRQGFDEVVYKKIGDTKPLPQLTVDAHLDFAVACNADFLHELDLLQPFGMANAEPVFVSPKLFVKNARSFGQNNDNLNLEVLDASTGITLQAKAWRIATQAPENCKGRHVYLAYTPFINNYNGVSSIEIRVKDWKWVD